MIHQLATSRSEVKQAIENYYLFSQFNLIV